jgi:hypothetical protein
VTKAIVVLLCLLGSVGATSQELSGAEAAMLKYVEATKTFDTAAMTAFMHPDALKRFRGSFATAFSGPKSAQAKRELLPLFSVTTAEDFAALSDSEAYKRMNDMIAKNAPETITMMSQVTGDIVGGFIEDNVAHVTYNLNVNVEGSVVKTQIVQTLKMHEGKWLLMLPSTADATIVGIDARYK